MSLNRAFERMKFDKRLIELELRNNKITQEEYQQHLASLEDLTSKMQLLWAYHYPDDTEDEIIDVPEDEIEEENQ